MNWGRGLTFVFIGFALLIGALVYGAMHTKFELVTKDYYRDELGYQEKIDGAKNASAAGEITLTADADSVYLQLPASLHDTDLQADAWFYCKVNSEFDQRSVIHVVNGRYSFSRKLFAAAAYELKLQLTAAGKKYYYTKNLSLR